MENDGSGNRDNIPLTTVVNFSTFALISQARLDSGFNALWDISEFRSSQNATECITYFRL